jgi:hypothetical protein
MAITKFATVSGRVSVDLHVIISHNNEPPRYSVVRCSIAHGVIQIKTYRFRIIFPISVTRCIYIAEAILKHVTLVKERDRI